MNGRLSLVAAIAGLVAWIAGLVIAPHTALVGWLAAFVAFASVPIGCLSILTMLILVPGTWRALYTRPMLLGSALLPVAAIAVLPLLIGLSTLYPWADPAATASFASFKAAWLSPGFFIFRQVAWFAITTGDGVLCRTGRFAIMPNLLCIAAKRRASCILSSGCVAIGENHQNQREAQPR